MGKLTDKVARGVFWTMLEKFGIQAARFLVTLVLARLLTPNDYGTVALVSVFITVANVLVDCGLGSALVQKKDATQTDYDTVFYLSMTFAVVLYVVLFFAAPFVARFYAMPELETMLRILAIALIFKSLDGVQGVELRRKMLFKLSFRISWVKVAVSSVVGISLALAGFGAWSLVWASVIGGFAACVMRQLVIRWRPSLTFSWSSAGKLYSFGWKIVAGALVSKLYNSLNSLVVGKCFTRADLAFVSKGTHVVNVAANSVDATISRVTLPALAKLQDDPQRMVRAMRRMVKSSTFFVFPMMAVFVVLSDAAVVTLFGAKWLPAAPYLRLACFTFALKPFITVNLQAILVLGRSGMYLALVSISSITGIVAMAVSYRWGVYAFVATGVFSVGIAKVLAAAWPNKKWLGYSLGKQMADVLPAAALSVLAGLAAFAAGFAFPSTSWWRLVVGCPVAVAVYLALAIFFRFSALDDIAGVVRPSFAKRLPAMLPLIDFIRRRTRA